MNNFFILDDKGSILKASLARVADADSLLKNIAQTRPVVLKGLLEPGIHVKVTSAELVLARKLEHVNLTTWFAPVTLPTGESRVTPVFHDNGVAVKQTLAFTPPEGHEVWFFQRFGAHGSRSSDNQSAYLAWHHAGMNLYRGPFGNVFDDGRICMGHNWLPKSDGSLADRFKDSVDWFQNAEANSDLRAPTAPIPLLLWDPANGMAPDHRGILDVPNFDSVARVVSNGIFDGFFNTNQI